MSSFSLEMLYTNNHVHVFDVRKFGCAHRLKIARKYLLDEWWLLNSDMLQVQSLRIIPHSGIPEVSRNENH